MLMCSWVTLVKQSAGQDPSEVKCEIFLTLRLHNRLGTLAKWGNAPLPQVGHLAAEKLWRELEIHWGSHFGTEGIEPLAVELHIHHIFQRAEVTRELADVLRRLVGELAQALKWRPQDMNTGMWTLHSQLDSSVVRQKIFETDQGMNW